MRALAVLLVLLLAGCRPPSSKAPLSEAESTFLSQVGYIMTREERKIFRELPRPEREAFIEAFWKRRDPDPETPVNEYRLEYESRVERAAMLFRGEGRPGWQTDRGRIYILFGPPMERLTYPMDARGFCREVWYYGNFPVVFVDELCSGHFVLTALNLEHLQDLNIAQGYFQKTFVQEKRFFDYEVAVRKVRADRTVYEGRIAVDVPYAAMWFTFEEGRLETVFDVRLELSDPDGRLLWEGRGSFPLTLTERELKDNRTRRFRMEFPFRLEGDMARLARRKLKLAVSVKSATEAEELRKALEVRLRLSPL